MEEIKGLDMSSVLDEGRDDVHGRDIPEFRNWPQH